MQPVVRMRFVVRAFLNGPSCVYVEPVNRSTYVVPERNGKFFLAPTVSSKHTISNKLVSKVFAQKKGGKSYDSYKYVFKFRGFQV